MDAGESAGGAARRVAPKPLRAAPTGRASDPMAAAAASASAAPAEPAQLKSRTGVRFGDCLGGRALVVASDCPEIDSTLAQDGAIHGLKIVDGFGSEANQERVLGRTQVSVQGAVMASKQFIKLDYVLSVDISDGDGAPKWVGAPVRAVEEGGRSRRARKPAAAEEPAEAPSAKRKRKKVQKKVASVEPEEQKERRVYFVDEPADYEKVSKLIKLGGRRAMSAIRPANR